MSANNNNLTFDDLTNLLFTNPIIKSIDTNMSNSNLETSAFGLNYWGYDGESDSMDLDEANMLIACANLCAIASAISLGDSAKNVVPEQTDNFMDFFDVLPEMSAMEDSPMMATPFLEGNTDTPFTPATSFTPCLNGFQASPYIASHMEDADVQVASYLNYATPAINYTIPWVSDSVATFNGNPTQLLLDKNKTVCETEQTDFLFPPLPSQESNYVVNDDFTYDTMDAFDTFLFNNDITYESLIDDNAKDIHQEVMPTPKKRKLSVVDVKPTSVRKRRTPKGTQSEDSKRFPCEICQCKFSRRFNLGTHMKTHVKDRQKDFVCNTCHKAFDRKHDCDRHIATVHRGERSYACNLCCSSFSRKDALFRHKVQKHDVDDVV